MKSQLSWALRLFKAGVYEPFCTMDGVVNSKQIQALKYLNDREVKELLYGGAKGGGKSYLGAFNQTLSALIYPQTQYFVAREELNDLRKWTMPTFMEVAKNIGLEKSDYTFNGQDNFIKFYNDSKINFLAAKRIPSDPFFERFGSMQNTGGWIEEGGEVDEMAYSNLKLSIGRCKNKEYDIPFKLLITANPKKNWMYNNIIKPYEKKELDKSIQYIQAFAKDNPGLQNEYHDTLNGIKDKRDRQRLLLGMWDYDDDDNSLCNFDKITDIFTNNFVGRDDKGNMLLTQNFMSCDIAISNDHFVCINWHGLRIEEIIRIKNISPTQIDTQTDLGIANNKIDFTPILNILERQALKYKVPRSNIAYDASGLGSHLVKLFPGAVPVRSGQVLHKEFNNLKSELEFLLAEMINSGMIYCNPDIESNTKEILIEELQMLKRSNEPGEKLSTIKTAQIKELIGHSPDVMKAITYRLLFWITRKT